MNATVGSEIPCRHNVRADIGREYLIIDCPDGWDDVKKICKKTLVFEGRVFAYAAWDSDANVAYFMRPLDGGPVVCSVLK